MAEQKQTLRGRMRAAIDAGAMRAPHNPSGAHPIFDGAEALATKRATMAVERGRPLRPSESRAARHEMQAEQQAARQPQAKPGLRDRLEAMSEEQRYAAIESVTPGTRERRYIEHLVDQIEADEEQAEYLLAVEDEQRALANIDDDGSWRSGADEDIDDSWAEALDRESRRLNAESGFHAMTPAEMRAVDAEVANANPWAAAVASREEVLAAERAAEEAIAQDEGGYDFEDEEEVTL